MFWKFKLMKFIFNLLLFYLGCRTAESICFKPRMTKKWISGSTRSTRRRSTPRRAPYLAKVPKENPKPCPPPTPVLWEWCRKCTLRVCVRTCDFVWIRECVRACAIVFVYMRVFVCVIVCLYVCLSVCVYLSVCPSVCLSVCLSVSLDCFCLWSKIMIITLILTVSPRFHGQSKKGWAKATQLLHDEKELGWGRSMETLKYLPYRAWTLTKMRLLHEGKRVEELNTLSRADMTHRPVISGMAHQHVRPCHLAS